MNDPLEPLILDLLEWIGTGDRPYRDVIEAWRTSCPRLPVWEEANSRGYIAYSHQTGTARQVCVSDAGRAFLRAGRGAPDAAGPANRRTTKPRHAPPA